MTSPSAAKPRESLGVFGGSFDPPHLGHVLCCVYAKLVHRLDRILVIPAGRHAFGKDFGAPAFRRLEMARLAFADLPFCEVSEIEFERLQDEPQRPSYMAETIEEVVRRWPGASPRLIVGTDLKGEVERWKRAGELLAMAPPAWVPRAGFLPEGADGMAFPGWSSSRLRTTLEAGGSAEGMVPAPVLDLIREAGLYRSAKG